LAFVTLLALLAFPFRGLFGVHVGFFGFDPCVRVKPYGLDQIDNFTLYTHYTYIHRAIKLA